MLHLLCFTTLVSALQEMLEAGVFLKLGILSQIHEEFEECSISRLSVAYVPNRRAGCGSFFHEMANRISTLSACFKSLSSLVSVLVLFFSCAIVLREAIVLRGIIVPSCATVFSPAIVLHLMSGCGILANKSVAP